MSKQTWIVCALLGSMLISCGKKTVGTSTTPVADELSIEPLDFEYLTASSKIRYRDGEQNISATANIRIKNDSAIWVSLTPGFGIEAARALITHDSLKLINRIDKEYQAYSFKELSGKFNFNLNYNLLQAVVIGDMLQLPTAQDQVEQQATHFLIRQREGGLTADNYVDARLMKLNRVVVTDKNRKNQSKGRRMNTLNLRYEDFQQIDGQWLPFGSELSLDRQGAKEKQRTQIDINHKKANIVKEALRFPFSIPDKYVRK